MADNQPIRVTAGDLYSPQVDDYLLMQQALRREVGSPDPQPWVIRVIYSSWFYLAIASGLGAFVAWAVIEPFFSDSDLPRGVPGAAILLFPSVAAGAGLFLGAAEGLMCRNLGRATISGLVGLGVGFVGGLLILIPAGILFGLMRAVAVSLWKNPQPDQMPTGLALVVFIMGRAAAWALSAVPAGLGQGVALREWKVVFNGVVGGVLGGLIGGILFDPIDMLFTGPDHEAALSRCIGLTIIGLMVGLFVGLVEGWTKTAWMLMRAGPLAGKQFIIFRDTTILGSSPKADVYLFKDAAIEPRHAVVYNRGGRFEIEDCNTRDGTYVNGAPIRRQMLQPGDQVVLGKTVLEFQIRQSQS